MALQFAKSISIPEEFVLEVSDRVKESKNLSDIPFDNLVPVIERFSVYLSNNAILDYLDNTDCIVFFDYEIDNNFSFSKKVIISASIFHMINSTLFIPAVEPENKIPFATFKSSADKINAMQKAGVPFYSPETKLGYHNDVFVKGESYFIPKYVSIVNLFIGYQKPGNFYFVNTNKWESFEAIFNNGLGKKFKFKPTPVVYESKLDERMNANKNDYEVEISAFWEDEKGQKIMFSNGELKDCGESDLIAKLKDSLQNSTDKIAVAQQLNRVIVFRNDKGFHSRDIFEEQQVFTGTTRLFLRSISEESLPIPRIFNS